MNDTEIVHLKDCLKGKDLDKYEIPICLGRTNNGEILIKDFADIHNLLISGATCSGKSVFLNSVINTILLTKTPKEVQLLLIDFKQAEFHFYKDIPHLKYPVIYDVEEAVYALGRIFNERDNNKEESYPDIVIVLEDYADFIQLERIHSNLFQDLRHWIMHILLYGNTLGIYTVLSSSKISDNNLLVRIRESIPNRLVGYLPTSEDSIIMLGQEGAEKLLGSGDMIYRNIKSGETERVQTPYISTNETEKIIKKF